VRVRGAQQMFGLGVGGEVHGNAFEELLVGSGPLQQRGRAVFLVDVSVFDCLGEVARDAVDVFYGNLLLRPGVFVNVGVNDGGSHESPFRVSVPV
jgi:hypothetical protein